MARNFSTGFLCLLLVAVLSLSACGAPADDSLAEDNTEAPNVDVDDNVVQVDSDEDGDADVQITQEDDTTEVVLDDVIEDIEEVENFCVPGTTFTFESEDGNVDSEVVGLTIYEGAERCEAISTTTISSPVGDITTDTTYYFDETFNEYWIVTTTSGAGMPTQENKIHLIDGEVQ